MCPNAGGGGSCGVSANEYSCAHGAQINFGDPTPYLTYDIYQQPIRLQKLYTHFILEKTDFFKRLKAECCDCIIFNTKYICRVQDVGLASSKILTPHPTLHPTSVFSPCTKGGGVHTRRGVRGWGGQYFEGRQT
jgi:hypothetical protein